jgi:DNA-directed RNA polymerase subunit RPC12/RpoP
MVKCSICGKKIEETFLEKIRGTYVRDEKGKLHAVCFECQKKFGSKDEIIKNIRA